jgi:ATP-dependent Lon protease
MNLSVKEKQDLLAINDLKERALETLRYMNIELQKLELKNIQSKVRFDLDQQQREYFLQQQMKTIQEELGGNTQEEEIDEMLVKAKDKKMG